MKGDHKNASPAPACTPQAPQQEAMRLLRFAQVFTSEQCSSKQCWLQSQVDLGMKWLPSIMSLLAILVVPVAATGANLMASYMPKNVFEMLGKIIHRLQKSSLHSKCNLILVCKVPFAIQSHQSRLCGLLEIVVQDIDALINLTGQVPFPGPQLPSLDFTGIL